MLEIFHKKALKTLPSNDIINISQTTTEKIENLYLYDFLKTCINNSNKKINVYSKIFYIYFEKNNLYEIYFIENFSNKHIAIPFIFSEVHNPKLNEVFLYDGYFTLYSKGIFLLFKKSSTEISSKDILDFIQNRYEIKIDRLYNYSQLQIKEIKDQYCLNKKRYLPDLITPQKDKKPFYLFGFTLFLLLIPLSHYNYFYNKEDINYKIDKKLISLEKKYLNLLESNYSKKTPHIINLLLHLKNFKIKFHSITLNNNKIYTFIESKDKLTLLEFVDKYDGDIKINKLLFNKQTSSYTMEIEIVI